MPKVPKSPPEFDPDLVETWKQGGITTKVIGPLDSGLARNLRHRLYKERLKMKRAGHPDYLTASLAIISLVSDPSEMGKLNLVIYPAKLAVNQALAKAGITPTTTIDPPSLDDE